MTTINVTAEHITAGQRCNPFGCAMALAIKAAFPKAQLISVGSTDFDIDDWTSVGELPLNAQAFVQAFDQGRPVAPISFEVEVAAA